MLVSILTPSYNQARWLSDNLKSVAAQDYPDIEHVVMDGGSMDGSLDILNRTQPRVRWLSESDDGQSHALNKALTYSQGEIIGWLNSDDAYFSRDVVSAVVNTFQRRPDVDVVYGHGVLVNADGLILHMMWVPSYRYQLLRTHDFIVQPAVFFRRHAITPQFLVEDLHFAMDYELWLRLGAASHRFQRIDKVLAIDRHQPLRKTVAHEHAAASDLQRLVQTYSLPVLTRRHHALVRLLRIGMRIMGIRLLVGLARHRLAFSGWWNSVWSLLLRQLTMPRSFLPFGSAVGELERSGEGIHSGRGEPAHRATRKSVAE
jgi:glycosyltransferase involved in cell wall biosynthesis